MQTNTPLRARPDPSRVHSDFHRHVAALEGRLATLHSQVRQAQQLASLGTSTATLAHEVNNLLTPIVGYADEALKRDDDTLRKKALSVTIRNARMLVAMSTRILQISAAKPAMAEPVSVHLTATDAAECLCRDLAKDGITFRNNVDADIAVRIDALALQQVFFNLFLNARDAMARSHGGSLTIEAHRRGDRVAIQVKDTGGGIPEALLPTIFDPLQSSKTPSSRLSASPLPSTESSASNSKASQSPGQTIPRCTGLGLALCRDLIQEHAGTISAGSNPGVGTTFTIDLPAATLPTAKRA